MKVRLNIATSPLENNRRFICGATLAGVLALGALVGLSARTVQKWNESRTLRGNVARLQSEIREYRQQRRDLDDFFKKPATRNIMDRAAFLNGLIDQRSFPWTKVFVDLERSLPEGVRVVSIAPRMSQGRVEVKLTIGAVSDESKLKFLKTVTAAREFSRVQVLSETRPTKQTETDRVLLEILVWYQTS